jgi:ubiquitin carboxyl-terminal hydrolase 8
LQCLSHTLGLTDYILSTDYLGDLTTHNKAKPEQFVLASYINLINTLWEANQLIKPKTFVENLSKFHKKYYALQQQDSHECLLYILDLLHNALEYEIEIEIRGEVKTEQDRLLKMSLQTWQRFFEKSYSFIIQTFYGCNINSFRCNRCKHTETVFEPYNNLVLDITDSGDNLSNLLEKYFSSEESIPGYRCDHCGTKDATGSEVTGCIKNTKLWNVPDYLIIQLKRFKKSGRQMSKNTALINYPVTDLNMTPYVSVDKHDRNNYIYDLYAVNCHSGGLDGGHYTSLCKNLDNNWYHFNDANVTKYTSQIVTHDAYILFYARKKLAAGAGSCPPRDVPSGWRA